MTVRVDVFLDGNLETVKVRLSDDLCRMAGSNGLKTKLNSVD